MAAILLDKRRIVRTGTAPEVGHGDGTALQQGRSRHARLILAVRARPDNRKQHLEQGLAGDAAVRALDPKQPALGDHAAMGKILSA